MSTPHIQEDLLDQYAIGALSGDSLGEVEEHLLLCPFCQKRLTEADEFVTVFRAAATQVDAHAATRLWTFQALFGTGAAAAAIALFAVFMISRTKHDARLPATIVSMQSLRGPESGAHIASGKPAVLVFDLTVQASGVDYQIEIVNAVGKKIVQAGAEVKAGQLTAAVENLAPGSYWVRVYRKTELLAEYGLRVE